MPPLPTNITIKRLTGSALAAAIDDLARLRLTVFADFPYLYDGDAAYEAQYLQTYLNSDASVLIAAYYGERIVGAATGVPLREETEDTTAPFIKAGYDLSTLFYFGESVLEPAYRGRGIGAAFLAEREAFARTVPGVTHVTFCGVQRPADHPSRPADYVPLDAFWTKRGYAPVQGLTTIFEWKDHDEDTETGKPMQFWMKAL